MVETEESVLQRRVRERMSELGFKPAPFAKSLGFGDSFIRDVLRKGVTPRADRLAKLADALGVTPDYLLGATDEPRPTEGLGPAFSPAGDVTYAGVVQAGLFRPVDEYFNQDETWERPPGLMRHPAYPRVRQYAWQSRGDSMNQAGIVDGQWIVGADAADYIDQYGDIESGDLVVVQRVRFGGAERELTVKEIRYYRDRYELHPRSSDPTFQPIIVKNDHSADDEEVTVIGVVLSAFTDLRRGRR